MVAGARVALLAASSAVAIGSTAGQLYHICGGDLHATDVRSTKTAPERCAAFCQLFPTTCNSGTWTDFEGGTCWFKQRGSTYDVTANAGAISFGWFNDKGGKPFVIKSGVNADMAGFDAGSARCPTANECGQMCASAIQCFAATWTDYNGGTCWFKSRASGFIPKAGASSYIIARPDDYWHECPRL